MDENNPVSVTERDEKEILQTANHLRLLLESIGESIYEIDSRGNCRFINNTAAAMLGYKPEELLGRNMHRLVHHSRGDGSPYPESECPVLGIFKSGEGRQVYDEVFWRSDGSFFPASYSSRPIIEHGAVIGAVVTFADITEQKRAEEILRESDQLYRIVAETASDSIITIDQDSVVLYANRATEKIFGYSPDELAGKDLTVLMPEYLRHLHRAGVKRYVETGNRHISWQGIELPGLHKSGAEIPLEVSFGEFIKEGKRFFTGIIRSITDRKLIEQRLAAQHSVTRILAGSSDLAESAPAILQTICETCGYEAGGLWAIDRQADILRCISVWCKPGIDVGAFEAASREHTFSQGVGLPGRVWASKEPAWIPDVATNGNFPRAAAATREGLRGAIAFPILLGEEVLGVIEFFTNQVGQPNKELTDMLTSIGSQVGQVIERTQAQRERDRLLAQEQAARAEAEAAAELHRQVEKQLESLIDASGILLGTLKLSSVLATVLDIARGLISADGYAIWRLQHETGRWDIVSSAGLSPRYSEISRELPLNTQVLDIPLAAEDVEQEPMLALRREAYATEGIRSLLVVPLRIHGENSGTIAFYYRSPHRFSSIEVKIASALANLAAAAISTIETYEEQARLRMEAEESELRTAFIAKTGEMLVASLDYETTLASVARMAVPEFADWCAVDIIGEGRSIHRLAVAHQDPSKMALVQELNRRYPPNPDDPEGVPKVMRTGKSETYFNIPDSLLVAIARDAEHLRILRELGFKSAMVVPLIARGNVLGTITFVTAESGRIYGPDDLAFSEELATRAAMAVDNARLYRDAQEANRTKDEFLATVSHELRTPLNAILGWARMLRTGSLDRNVAAQAAEVIERNAKSQAQIIEDILDVSRIITGKLRIEVGAVDLPSIIRASVDTVRPAADAKNIKIQTILDSGAGPVSGDPNRLQQVVWNLLSNAIKFTPKGGRVQVRLERVDSHVELSVSDTGKGIGQEVLPHIFERFWQADSSSTRLHGGLGLGLAIVRHLVELHGGSVQVDSAGEGQGSTFTLKLPILVGRRKSKDSSPARLTAEAEWSLDLLPALNGLRVLVVDDEADTRALLIQMLSHCGVDVRASASAAEALEEMQNWRPDVLVSDIGMPIEDGYALIRRVRALSQEQGGKIPAIALTAYARTEDRIRSLSAGYQVHVPKPVDLSELAMAIASLAGRTG